jgi:putative membrane protein
VDLAHFLPHWNASLNALATVLLVAGLASIKSKREGLHKWTMVAAFATSILFLASYIYYHVVVKQGISTPFPSYPPDWVRYTYYVILLSHILLAMAVPVLAIWSIVLGLRDRRAAHRRLSWFTLPIWLYVSVTGVVVYAMLYHAFPPEEVSPAAALMPASAGATP